MAQALKVVDPIIHMKPYEVTLPFSSGTKLYFYFDLFAYDGQQPLKAEINVAPGFQNPISFAVIVDVDEKKRAPQHSNESVISAEEHYLVAVSSGGRTSGLTCSINPMSQRPKIRLHPE